MDYKLTENIGTLPQNCPGSVIIHFPDGEEPASGIITYDADRDLYQVYDQDDDLIAVFESKDINRWNTYIRQDGLIYTRRVYLNK